MNKQPVYYMQTDSRWKSKDYSAKGEKTTIGASGCGPTCAAMLIETLTGKKFTPEDACAWALSKGYKAPNQGTYYSYFVPQFKAHGITCTRLNMANLYGNKTSPTHAEAFKLLKQGYYLIACMGKGVWTSSGHYIVVWWEDGKVRINDPASTKTARLNGDLTTFKSQVKYYWAIDAREYNKEREEVVNLTLDVLRKGKKSECVKALQVLLDGNGYHLMADGSFGPATETAVKQFQMDKKLTVDGVVGAKTWEKLLKG